MCKIFEEEFGSLISSEGSHYFSDDAKIKSINHLINIIFEEEDRELLILRVADVIKYLNAAFPASNPNDVNLNQSEVSDIKFITEKYIMKGQPFWEAFVLPN